MVAGEVEFVFTSRNERSFSKKKLKSKLEIIVEKRMLDRYYLSTVCSVINAKIY